MMKSTFLLLLASLILVAGCGDKAAPPTTAATTAGGPVTPVKQGISKLTALTKEDVKPGDGMVVGIKVDTSKGVENGDIVSIQYTGKLQDGTVFDTNVPNSKINGQEIKHDKPMNFIVGRGRVVPGLDQGVLGMKIGGVRKLGIPPNLGYGSNDNQTIPANSDLLFEIKMLNVVKPGEESYFDSKDLKAGSGRAIKEGDTVQIEYVLKSVDGQVIDTNVGKEPREFTIGAIPAQVISGIERGVIGMKKGGERLLRIPPGIAYGTKLIPDNSIPPNSTLIAQVKILEVM